MPNVTAGYGRFSDSITRFLQVFFRDAPQVIPRMASLKDHSPVEFWIAVPLQAKVKHYKCKKCLFSYYNSAQFERHLPCQVWKCKNADRTLIECGHSKIKECNEEFATKFESIEHHGAHNVCLRKGCGIRFASANMLKAHLRGRHIEEAKFILAAEKRGYLGFLPSLMRFCTIAQIAITLQRLSISTTIEQRAPISALLNCRIS